MTHYSNNHYNPELKFLARKLRKSSNSKSEKFLWKRYLSRRQSGVRFLRQRPIDKYIVDFFAPEIALIIEIDGSSHMNTGAQDSYREERLRSLGYEILRFTESEVICNIEMVCTQLNHAIYCLRKASEE